MHVFFTKLSFVLFTILFGSAKAMEFRKQEFYLASDEGLGQEIGQRLEAFFWTGSGDGPPAPEEAPSIEPTPPKTLVRTTTVLATVYLDGADPSMSVTDTSGVPCIGCGPGEGAEGPGPPGAQTPPDDPRYWLLTVVRGGTPDALQVRLARLYQKAFLRQQERHLGIVRALDVVNNRKKHEVHSILFNNTESNYSKTEDTNDTREFISPSPSSLVRSVIDLTGNSEYFEAETFLSLPTMPRAQALNESNANEIEWKRHPKLLASNVIKQKAPQNSGTGQDNGTESQFLDKKKAVQKRESVISDEDDWSYESDAVAISNDFHDAKNAKYIPITSLTDESIFSFLPASSVMTTHKKDLSAEDFTDWSDVSNSIIHLATPNLEISPKSVDIGQKRSISIHLDDDTNFSSNNIIPTRILSKREVDAQYYSTTSEIMSKDTHKEASKGDKNVEDFINDAEELQMEEELNGHLEISDDDLNGTVVKREIITPEQQPPVKVYIHNISEISSTHDVEIVYSVLVGGRAVPAAVAARDMRLVHEREVARELGYPVTTKAEPYLKTALPLNGVAQKFWSNDVALMASGASLGCLLLLLVALLLCRSRRKRAASSAALTAYRNELMRQTMHVTNDREEKLISVVSPSRTRPSPILPIYRADSTTSTSSGSGLSDIASALRLRQRRLDSQIQQARRDRGRHRKMRQKRVGAADSLLVSAGVSESDSGGGSLKRRGSSPATPSVGGTPGIGGTPSVPPRLPQTPTSYLSMPSVRSFPRGNTVEPLSKVLEPVSVRHLDIDSPVHANFAAKKHDNSTPPKVGIGKPTISATNDVVDENPNQTSGDVVPRRRMSSQLVRLGSMDRDPGVIGPLVWDLHCQRMKDLPRQQESLDRQPFILSKQVAQCVSGPEVSGENTSRMRRRFSELVDDAFSLFGSRGGSPKAGLGNKKGSLETTDERTEDKCFASLEVDPSAEMTFAPAQARNDEVKFPGSQNSAIATIRGWDMHNRPTTSGTFMQSPVVGEGASGRPRTALPRQPHAVLQRQQHTALPRQPGTALPWQQQLPVEIRAPPSRAWDTPSPTVRAASAGLLPDPGVNVARVLVDARLPPGDPALPLINAIKSEIRRVRDYTHTHPMSQI